MGSFFEAMPIKTNRVTEKNKKISDKQKAVIQLKATREQAVVSPGNAFFFQSQSAFINNKNTKNLPEVINPILWDEPDPEIYIISTVITVPGGQNSGGLDPLWRFMREKMGDPPIRVVYAFSHNLGDLVSNAETVVATTIDLTKYIPPYSKVVSMGWSGIVALTKSTDIQVKAFYDYLYNQSYFFSPTIKSWVFPTDQVDHSWMTSQNRCYDSFAGFFLKFQCLTASEFKPPSRLPPDPIFVRVDDPSSFLKSHPEACEVVWDLETSGFGHTTKRVICLTLTFDGVTGYFLPWDKIDLTILDEFFENKIQIGANLKFDCKFTRYRGVKNTWIDFDTMHAGHVLNEMRSNSLKTHAFLFTYWGGYDDGLEEYKKKYKSASKDYSLIPIPILMPYAIMDVIVCYHVYRKFQEQLKNDDLAKELGLPSLESYYYNEVIPSVNLYLKSELRGLDVDWDRCREVEQIMLPMIASAKQAAHEALIKSLISNRGFSEVDARARISNLNIDSTTELGAFLEKVLQWPMIEATKTETYKTGKIPMTEWKKMGFVEAGHLLEYSQIKATYNAFVGNEAMKTGLWKYKTPEGRIYPTFAVMMAMSGRNKSSGPNFQNFPMRSKYAALIRSIFKAPPGFVFGETDGAGLQLRIGASQSNDPVMREAFMTGGGDLHSITAHNVFCKKYPSFSVKLPNHDEMVTSLHPVKVLRNGIHEHVPLFQVLDTDSIVELFHQDETSVEFKPALSGRLVTGLMRGFAAPTMTLEELKSWKEVKPYKTKRSKAKGVNFGAEFGTVAFGFGLGLLHQEWTIEECRAFIQDEKLHHLVEKWASREKSTGDKALYIACAEFILDEFFNLYAGLKQWQLNNIKFGETHGCIRTPFGARRLLPELTVVGTKSSQSHIKNLRNITANDPVQNHEVVVMHRAMRYIDEVIVKNNFTSIIIGNVHDAVVGYYNKSEMNQLVPVIDQAFSIDHPENNGIPYEGESNFADPDKGEGWGFGKHNVKSEDVPDYDFYMNEDEFD